MGMDLVAQEPTATMYEQLHFNWAGWGILRDLLYELGCDLAPMSGSNDGDPVSNEVSQAWGQAIVEGMGRIIIVKYPDRGYTGGFRTELKVEGSQRPVILSTAEASRALAAELLHRTTEYEAVASAVIGDARPSVTPVSAEPETVAWLERASSFFLNCGGFEQF